MQERMYKKPKRHVAQLRYFTEELKQRLVQKWDLFVLLFIGELDVACRVNGVDMVRQIPHLPLFIESSTSSTYRFHSFGLHSTGAVAMACFSNHSMNKLTRSGETGLPIAAPNLCNLYNIPERKVGCCDYEIQ